MVKLCETSQNYQLFWHILTYSQYFPVELPFRPARSSPSRHSGSTTLSWMSLGAAGMASNTVHCYTMYSKIACFLMGRMMIEHWFQGYSTSYLSEIYPFLGKKNVWRSPSAETQKRVLRLVTWLFLANSLGKSHGWATVKLGQSSLATFQNYNQECQRMQSPFIFWLWKADVHEGEVKSEQQLPKKAKLRQLRQCKSLDTETGCPIILDGFQWHFSSSSSSSLTK